MADRRRERLELTGTRLDAEHIDALLITSLANIRYLTGFSGTSALALATRSEIHLITDFRYETQVADEVVDHAHIRIEPVSLWGGLWNILAGMSSIEVLGFESAHLYHRDFQRLLGEGSRWQWRPHVNIIEALRESKDADEVELIAGAAHIATEALQRIMPLLAAGMTELEIAGILEKALRDEGSEEAPFAPIVASGPRSALPHARASNRTVKKGDLLLLDFGAQHKGYCSDITRTFTVGPPAAEQREVYQVVRDANHIASHTIRAGMTGSAADALARGYIERCGHGEAFGHSLGHGLGLEVHESPRLARTAGAALVAGSVVTIEPGIYRPGWGGVRIEDDIHLSGNGPQILTNFSRELIEIA